MDKQVNKYAYEKGFRGSVIDLKKKAEEGAGQAPVASKTMGPDAALKTTNPFGEKAAPGKENLKDIVMKDAGLGQGNNQRSEDRFSHGPGSTTSGQGTDNN